MIRNSFPLLRSSLTTFFKYLQKCWVIFLKIFSAFNILNHNILDFLQNVSFQMGDYQSHLNGFIDSSLYLLGLSTTLNQHVDFFIEILQNLFSKVIHFPHVNWWVLWCFFNEFVIQISQCWLNFSICSFQIKLKWHFFFALSENIQLLFWQHTKVKHERRLLAYSTIFHFNKSIFQDMVNLEPFNVVLFVQ